MNRKLVWVGPRESDIQYGGVHFWGSITINGKNTDNNASFTSKIGTRIDHNNATKWEIGNFFREHMSSISNENDEIYFMFYNPLQAYSLGYPAANRSVCLNQYELLQFLRNKANMREFAQKIIPVVPYIEVIGEILPAVKFNIGEKDTYIIQNIFSSGGHGTIKMSRDQCAQYIAEHHNLDRYLISPFLKNAAPINVHTVIFDDSCIVLPPSFQLIQRDGQFFSYIGGDFRMNLSAAKLDLIEKRASFLAEELRRIGYRGVCGMDFLLTDEELFFLELNPRFQASSFLMNKQLIREGKPSLIEMSLQAFSGCSAPINSFMCFSSPESFFTINGEKIPDWGLNPDLPKIVDEIILDGLSSNMRKEPNSYLFRVITKRNLCWLDRDSRLHLAPNIDPDSSAWKEKILNQDPLALKIGLLNQGIRFSKSAEAQMAEKGIIVRQGVFQSVDLFLDNGLVVNTPYHTDFSDLTPYCVEYGDEQFYLEYNGSRMLRVTFDAVDPYRERVASGGTLFRNVTFWATDRLRVHHQFRCQFKERGVGCNFCNVRIKEGVFSLDDVCEAIDYYLEHTDFRHFLVGGGSGSLSSEYESILRIVKHIRTRCDKPIYAMCLPPEDISVLRDYYDAGINEIGFNLEIFDREIAKAIMPGKGCIPRDQYEQAFREAVRLWGNQGNVRSLMVLGLESIESFYSGIEWLCGLGVMPIISVFRPLNNIVLRETLPYGNEELERIYYHASKITERFGLVLGPHCVACQNNTLSLPISKTAWG